MNEYLYYTIYREPGPGCQPKLGLIRTVSYGERKNLKRGHAWGEVIYDRELSTKEMKDFELGPSTDGPCMEK